MYSSNILFTQQQEQSVDITVTDLSYFISVKNPTKPNSTISCFQEKQDKYLLNHVSIHCKSGEITTIMGASGSGKTTLLDAISYKVQNLQNISGTILANNLPYDENHFGNFANYVTQNDILFETMTVKQTLMFAADLRILENQAIKQQKVALLIKDMKLQNCSDTLIGGPLIKGISGGQKKRISIAVQLISNPQVIILDEPTSGLDSLTAFVIVKHLKKLAFQKKTVIMTIHQPNNDIFNLFDKLILLLDGNVIFQSQCSSTLDYFNGLGFQCPSFTNPADYIMSIIHPQSKNIKDRINIFMSSYKDNHQKQFQIANKSIVTKVIQQRKVASSITTIKALLKRQFINVSRNPIIIKARFINAVIVALFLSGLNFNFGKKFDPSNGIFASTEFRGLTGSLFFFTINSMMMSLSPVALTFPSECKVFRKQKSTKMYGVLSYFLSHNIIQIPYLIIVPLIQSIIMYWMMGLTASASKFFTFFLVIFFMSLSGSSIGLLMGSLTKNPMLAMLFYPLVLLFVVFSGYFKNRADLPDWVAWVEYISPIKYGFIALVSNQLSTPWTQFLSFELGLWSAIFCLIGLAFGYRLLSLFFLWKNS